METSSDDAESLIFSQSCLSFANYVEPGTYTFRYLARVRAGGTVTAPPAKAEEMYHPEHCGFTETQALTSKGFE